MIIRVTIIIFMWRKKSRSLLFTFFILPLYQLQLRPEGHLLRRAGGDLEVHNPAPIDPVVSSGVFSGRPMAQWCPVAQAIEPVGGLFRAKGRQGLQPKRIFEALNVGCMLAACCVMSAIYCYMSAK